MDFSDQIKSLASRVPRLVENIKTEEAAKNALIMPFINALGYNVFDPAEVHPEFTADHGIKKGEKVDYAILRDGKPTILIECKGIDAELNKHHASQLYRYFSVTDVKVGVLTNGIIYRFYSDLETPNKMDDKPFLEINMLDLKDPLIEELKRFTKDAFNLDELLTAASELKYTREIKQILALELASPSKEFSKYFASKVYSGKFTQSTQEYFTGITKKAFTQFINERINERLKSAMAEDHLTPKPEEGTPQPQLDEGGTDSKDDIVTTEDEREAFFIVRAILYETVDPKRVVMRDVKRYCGILLDDNNRKPICRLYLNTKQKYLGLFDENRNEEKIPIEGLSEIFRHSDLLKRTVLSYDGSIKSPAP